MKKQKLTWYWFGTYILSALVILAGLILLAQRTGPDLESWLLQKLIPPDWQPVYRDMVDRLFREELSSFLVTSGFGIGIIVIGMTLFPLKEKLSSTYEEEHFPDLRKHQQPPLLEQGLEEVKLAILYLLLQSLSLYLALQGHQFLAAVGSALSVSYLILAMALDHCAPFFQRRGRQIHGIIWILLRHAPRQTALIGALFICPSLLLEKLLPATLAPAIAIGLLVLSEVLGMAFATLAGCHLGAKILSRNPGLVKHPPPRLWTWSYRITLLFLTLWMGIFFSWWAKGSLRHSRFLKSKYHPIWSEMAFKIREGDSDSHARILISLPIKVTNRSKGSIDPTKLDIELVGTEVLEADVTLSGKKIEAHSSETLTLDFAIQLPIDELARGDISRFTRSNYSAHIILEPPLSRTVKIPLFLTSEDD